MHDKAPQYLCDNFEQRNRNHNRNTRRNGDLDIPKFRTSIGQRSFKYKGTKIWRDMEPLEQPQRRAIRSFFNDYTCTEYKIQLVKPNSLLTIGMSDQGGGTLLAIPGRELQPLNYK